MPLLLSSGHWSNSVRLTGWSLRLRGPRLRLTGRRLSVWFRHPLLPSSHGGSGAFSSRATAASNIPHRSSGARKWTPSSYSVTCICTEYRIRFRLRGSGAEAPILSRLHRAEADIGKAGLLLRNVSKLP